MILSLAGAYAQALPKGGQYVAGSGSIASSGSAMTITQSSIHGIINWQGFSIGSANKVWFNNGNGATLNRVMGGNLSQIDGLLSATGSVYLINPSGLVVGPGGKVITGGSFIGSTLSISNQQFMQGGALDFSHSFGGPNGAVINNGKIVSQNGNVTLIGYSASNTGSILAPGGTVAVAAGSQVLLRPLNGPAEIYVAPGVSGNATNSGRIKAAAASLESAGGNVYELAGNQTGLIDATGSQTVNGQVWLTAPQGTVSVSGTVQAKNANGSGGAIIAKGQSVALSAGSSLNAAGITGAGQIETSGQWVSLGGKVSAGQGGTWTIDPTDLTVDSTAATTIDGDLGSGNVTLQTTASGASGPGTQNASGVGDININSAISWSANTTLTLDAYHGVTINSPITSTGSSAGLTIKTNDGGSGGNFTVNSPVSLASSASLAINGNTYTLINSESGLEGMSSSAHTALNSDITLDSSYAVYSSFGGTLEGLGHTVSGLSINNSDTSDQGLFNIITGTVENLNVSGNVTASGNAGILASENLGTIYNVHTSGSVTASNELGGVVGYSQGTIADSSSSATLTITPSEFEGGGSIGGLVGYNSGSVTNSSSTGSIGISNSAEDLTDVGGLIGDNTGPVTNSYSTENITLGQYEYSTGGLIGYDNGNVTGSYATGSITLGNYNWYTGGLIGEEFEATISDSYSTGSINAGTSSYYTGGFLGQADYSSTIQTSYSAGAVTASGSYIGGFLGGTTGGGGFGYPTFTSDYWNEDRSGTTTGVGSGSSSGVTGLSASGSSPFSTSSYTGFNFTTTPGATGNNWVIVDTDGTLNGSNGGTMPLLASEYSTTINNAHQLQLMSMDLSASYVLGSSIDASATGSSTSASTGTDVWGSSGFIPVGNDATVFSGSLNGQGNSISNLSISASETLAGLFGRVGSTGVIENLGLLGDSTTDAGILSNAGGLAGLNGGTITDAYTTGPVTTSGAYATAGGLVGYNSGTITGAHATGAVAGGTSGQAGGLAGVNNGTVTDSYATGAVSASGSYAGGLAGANGGTITGSYASGAVNGGADTGTGGLAGYNNGTITDVYASGAVTGGADTGAGGLVGYNDSAGAITNAYSTGAVSCVTGYCGGVVGYDNGAPFTDVYWDTTTSGATTGVGTGSSSGVTGETTAQLQSALPAGFSSSTWGNVNNQTTPYLLNNPGPVYAGNLLSTLIFNVPELQAVNNNLAGNYALATDIDANGYTGFTPIGESTGFTGTFNGLGNTVSNLVISTSASYAGLFGQIGSGGVVKNVGLLGGSITDTASSGAGDLAGYNDGTITGAYGTGAVSTAINSTAGGLVGYNASGGTIVDAYATGSLTGNYDTLGGLAGENDGTITNGYATGAVNGGVITGGGLVGYNTGTITNAYSTGALTSSGGPVGGLVGNNSGSFTDVYWDTTTSGTTTGVGTGSSSGVSGETTAQLQAELPGGFSSSTWGNVNNQTTPYLLNNLGPVYVGNLLSTLIFNMPELQAANNNPADNYALATDIDASGYTGFTPIGESTAFTGTFNGLGNTVANLTINTTATYAGLFGQVGSGGVVENVGLTGGSATDNTTGAFLGGLAGHNAGTITNAYATGAVSGGRALIGGLVGYNIGTITDSYATGAVSDTPGNSLGGLVGYNAGTITDAWATGAVSGTGNALGGLAGINTGTITDAYATGEVTGSGNNSDLGGLVGLNAHTITDAYATGEVTGSGSNSDLGGLVGYNDDGAATITDAYATGAVSGTGDVGGLVGLNENTITASYWDTITSGTTTGIGSGSTSGATGLTTLGWLTQGPVATGAWDTTNTWVAGYPYPVLQALPYVLVTGSGTETYGSSTPAATISTILDQNGNDATSLVNTSSLTWLTSATSTSNVGSGPYVLGGIGGTVSSGYQLTYTGPLTIDPATLTAALTGTVSKTYDGTTTATLAPANYTLSGIIGSDQVTLNDPASGTYASQNAGTGIGVAVSGLTLSGAAAGNYVLASTTVSGNVGQIVPATLTAGLTGTISKTYDGATTASLVPNNYTLSGVIGSDQVTLNDPTTGAYASQNAGTGIGVSVSGLTLSGSAAGNYVLGSTTVTGDIGTITPATLTAGLTGLASKIYNGTTTATLAPDNYTLNGVIGSDQVTLNDPTSGSYASKNAGTGIGVTVSGLTMTGSAAGNYTLASTTVSADIGKIVPATLTAGLTGTVSSTYNGTTAATLAPDNYTLSGVIGSDQVTLNDPTSGVYASKNAGTGIGVTVSGLTLSGSAAGNYMLASTTVTGNVGQIVPATLTAGLTGVVSSIANGTTAATLTPANYTLTGVIPGDQVTLNDPTSGVYGAAAVGTGIPVTVSGLSLLGANAGNYTLASTSITGDVGVIMPAGPTQSTQATLLPFITTLPTPVAASGGGSLVLVGAGNGFGPIPLILLPSNTVGTTLTQDGVSLSTGVSLTVDPEQTLNQTGGVRHLNVNLPPAQGGGSNGGQQ